METEQSIEWIKSIIGKIAFLKTNKNYEDSLKMIPASARIMKSWELLRLYIEDSDSLKKFPKLVHIWTEKRACWLDNFVYYSDFIADLRFVGLRDALRGVCIVKRNNK